jgi:hypothetical protein
VSAFTISHILETCLRPRGGTSLSVRDPAGNCVELASPRLWGLADA